MGVLIAALAIVLGLGGATAVRTTILRGHVLLQAVEPQCGAVGCLQPARSTLQLRARSGRIRTVRADARLAYRPGR